MPFPAMVKSLHTVKPRTHGTERTNIKTMLIIATFRLLNFVSSSQKDIMFSKTAITVEKAAKIIKIKNKEPTILPKGIVLKMLESVVKRKPAPTVEASAVTPLL